MLPDKAILLQTTYRLTDTLFAGMAMTHYRTIQVADTFCGHRHTIYTCSDHS